MELVYKKERRLFAVALAVSLIAWLALVGATRGAALLYLPLFFIAYLFAQSGFISHLKGTGVHITAEQFPDLHQRIQACCRKLGIEDVPDAYLIHVGGAFNALATRFLGRNFIVLYSDVVDALEEHPGAVNFYIGHELGHIRRGHLKWGPALFPAGVLPLLGAAYSRAREYTSDRHGFACCERPEDAALGLAVLAAGGRRWRSLSRDGYASQARRTGEFWMSFHELIGDYPWLVKRMAALNALAGEHGARPPRRHPLAWPLALFVPRLGLAQGGGVVSIMVAVAMVGILAAIAIPSYQGYVNRAHIMNGMTAARPFQQAVLSYAVAHHAWPNSNDDVGLPATAPAYGQDVRSIALGKDGAITITFTGEGLSGKSLILDPYVEDSRLRWRCASPDVSPQFLPPNCR